MTGNTLVFVAAILPRYWKKEGNITMALPPRSIFKALSYVNQTAATREFAGKTRDFLKDIFGFLEGCLFHLYTKASPYASPNLPFGKLVEALHKQGVLSDELARQLGAYNRVVNVSSKNFDAFPMTERLDQSTFSVNDAANVFVMMRKLAIPLFILLKKKGVLEAEWPPFDERWLTRSPLMDEGQERKGGLRSD